MIRSSIILAALCVSLTSTIARSEDPAPSGESKQDAAVVDRDALFKQFGELLSGAKLVGRFTILGKDDGPLPKEEYAISSVSKLPEGDYWLFKARIKYGQNDVTVPLPLEVKWAGDTPIITLTDFTIPGMGTFSARVAIYDKKYAGTWAHGKVGGHLFGVIEKAAPEEPNEPAP
ncbi:MAG: hypothetical protein O3C40_12025 [Planctomycetota bacterium]|nr:hypothetical protein [Planctomycetota bacterium]